ncbi:MAG: 30S ribosomal protein S2 [bacterium]|nr:30S ribosomal protein S2 [bacterium]
MLVDRSVYLQSGIHIGTAQKNKFMEPFIYTQRKDGLYIFDINKIDERIAEAARILAKYEPSEILVVANRMTARKPAQKFAEYTKCLARIGRFIPGTLTNPNIKYFLEPEVLIAADPIMDKQAIREAKQVGIFVIALVNTFNPVQNIDFIIPGNNRGKKALALFFYLLAREYLRARGVLGPNDELSELKWKEFEPTKEEVELPIWIKKQLEELRRRRRKKARKKK